MGRSAAGSRFNLLKNPSTEVNLTQVCVPVQIAQLNLLVQSTREPIEYHKLKMTAALHFISPMILSVWPAKIFHRVESHSLKLSTADYPCHSVEETENIRRQVSQMQDDMERPEGSTYLIAQA